MFSRLPQSVGRDSAKTRTGACLAMNTDGLVTDTGRALPRMRWVIFYRNQCLGDLPVMWL